MALGAFVRGLVAAAQAIRAAAKSPAIRRAALQATHKVRQVFDQAKTGAKQLCLRLIGVTRARPDFSKASPKKLRQMQQRGWTQQQVQEAFEHGKRYPVVNKATGGSASRYVHPRIGQSVVLDDVTGQPIHFGGPGFQYGPGSGDLF